MCGVWVGGWGSEEGGGGMNRHHSGPNGITF